MHISGRAVVIALARLLRAEIQTLDRGNQVYVASQRFKATVEESNFKLACPVDERSHVISITRLGVSASSLAVACDRRLFYPRFGIHFGA